MTGESVMGSVWHTLERKNTIDSVDLQMYDRVINRPKFCLLTRCYDSHAIVPPLKSQRTPGFFKKDSTKVFSFHYSFSLIPRLGLLIGISALDALIFILTQSVLG